MIPAIGQTPTRVRPSAASNLDVRRALSRLGVRSVAETFSFYKSDHPALAGMAARAGRVADARMKAVGHSIEGVEREVSFLVAEGGDDRVLAVAVAYALGGPFKPQTTVVVDPATMVPVYL